MIRFSTQASTADKQPLRREDTVTNVAVEMNVVENERGNVGEDVPTMTVKEKVLLWDQGSIKQTIRDKLYPLAKIIFNSEEELKFDGQICKVIMDNVRFEDNFKDMTAAQKENHKRGLWAVWSTLVSKGLDSKRHNQKTTLREVFWGECKWVLLWLDSCLLLS